MGIRFRSSKLSTLDPEVKLEDREDVQPLITAVGSAEGLGFKIRRLTGNRPVYFRPEGQVVDEDNDLIYFYWQDVNHGPFRLTCLSLKTGRWTENRRLLKIKNSWNPLSRQLNSAEAPLPQHRGAADAFCVVNGHRVILIFGGMGAGGTGVTADLFLICLDMSKWWKVDIPDEVSPRMDAKMTFIDNHLYIFGGRDRESYSIAKYDTDSDKWAWIVRDRPYPSNVPTLGFAGNVISVYEGAQILLIPGCTDTNLDPPYSHCSASHVVLFDTAHQTFRVYDDVKGSFPVNIYGMNSFLVSSNRLLSGTLAVKAEPEEGFPEGLLNACSSVIIATWHEDDEDDGGSSNDSSSGSVVHDIPDLWLLNLSTTQQSDCSRLNIHDKLDSLGITIASCAALADRRIILLGSSSSVPNTGVIDRCIEIDF